MESIQIYINSKSANKFIDNNIANAQYIFPVIEIPDGHHLDISVQKASIPNSMYNIPGSIFFRTLFVDEDLTNHYLPYNLYNDWGK